MSENLNFGDELPCGGYVQEDKLIQKNMLILSQQSSQLQKDPIQTKLQTQSQKQNSAACQSQCNGCGSSKIECCTEKQCQAQNYESKFKKQEKKDEKKRKQTICKKCKSQPSALIHKNDPICRQCLLKNIEYKCRLTLQNSMKVTGKSKILICFSGGLNSICLVYLFSSLKKRYQKHHLFGELRCIHVQQQSTLPEKYKQNFEKQTGIPLEILKIGQVFEGQNRSLQDVKNVISMFNKAANSADLLGLFRDRLIVNYAKQNGFDFIVKGLNGQSIAGSIFKFFTKGIGGNVTELSSAQPDCLYHYPLRQHLQKQLQYYFYTMRCSKISLQSKQDDLTYFCSTDLDDHLNDFILDLQSMYSHTAPAITRTSEKIQSNRKNEIRCNWCMLKGVVQPHGLCRKCERIYECKNKNFDVNKIPAWLKVAD